MSGTTSGSICVTSCPRMLGMSLTTNGTTLSSLLEKPCAWKNHVFDGAEKKISSALSDDECHQSFFGWVKSYRSPGPDTAEDELRMCPLLWCRRSFGSKELAVRHVLDCPYLSNGWYWCPYHKRPERFLECNKQCESSRLRFRDKDSKLCLADKFLHWICRRRSWNRPAELEERTPCHPSGTAKIDGDEVGLPELASPESVGTLTYEMCDPSTPPHEMWDSSHLMESPRSTSFQRQDSPELLHPIHGESGRRSLLQKMLGMPALNPRCSATKRSRNSWPSMHETGNRLSHIAREASKADDLPKVPKFETKPTSIANSTPQTQSDRNSCTIFVETDIFRESSNSSGGSTEIPCVETVISSSPRPMSLDLDRQLPTLPQSKPLDLNRPLPPTPISNDTQMLSTTTRPLHHLSVMSRDHRWSGSTSVSFSDPKIVGYTPTDTMPNTIWPAHDTSWESHSPCEPSFMSSASTDDEIIKHETLAGNASSQDSNRTEEPRTPYPLWNTISPSTLAPPADSPASNFVSPSFPNSQLPSPFSNMFPPISPITESAPQLSNIMFPAPVTHMSPDIGMVEHYEDTDGGWIDIDPLHSESATKELEHTAPTSNVSEPHLLSQPPVLHRTVSLASEAQSRNESMPEWLVHPFFNCGFPSDGWNASPVYTRPFPLRMESSDLACSIPPSAIDELLESDPPPSSMKKSIMTQVGTPNSGSPVLSSISSSAAPSPDTYMDSIFMDESVETVKAEMPVSISTSVDMHVCDYSSYKLPLPSDSRHPPSSSSSLYTSERRPGVALWSRRQTNVPPLPLSRSNISSSDEKSGDVVLNPRRSKAISKSLTLNQDLAQSLMRDGKRSFGKFARSESHHLSAHQCRPNLANALSSPFSPKTLPHCFDHRSLLVTHSSSKQTQVEDLQALVVLVNDDWMPRLRSVPVLGLRCSVLGPRTLLEKGIRTLRECFRGRFAHTFEDIFAFMHLVFAAAFLLHCQQNIFCLDAFYDYTFHNNAMQWQHALSNKEDKILFLKAMDRLCWLPELQPLPLFSSGRHTSFGGISSREPLDCTDQTDLLEVLRNSEIFQVCRHFLDGFEEAIICDRNARFPADALVYRARCRIQQTEHIVKHVTHPLLQERGVEALRRVVIDTEHRIDRGLLWDLREVEVTLNTSGRFSSESSEVSKRYHTLVTSHCNKAMRSSNSDWYSSWRNDHYIVDLDEVLKVLKQWDRCDSIESASQPGSGVNGFEVITPNSPTLHSPAPWTPTSNEAREFDSSPTSAMSWVSTGSSERPEVSTPTTSLTTSPTSQAPDTPTTPAASCLACSMIFTGSPQDAKSNYHRHLRTSRRHNKNAGLKCPLPECRMRAPMRSDNLGPHLQKKHKMSQSERQALVEETRRSARRANSEGKSRRQSRRR